MSGDDGWFALTGTVLTALTLAARFGARFAGIDCKT
jgi:hypothetical protein